MDAGSCEDGFGFFDFLGFGMTTACESSSLSSVAVTDGVGVGLGAGSDVATSEDASGVGVRVATGPPSGDKLRVAALGADKGACLASGADSVWEEHAVRPAQRRPSTATHTRTFIRITQSPDLVRTAK